jgi:hypothetical protein
MKTCYCVPQWKQAAAISRTTSGGINMHRSTAYAFAAAVALASANAAMGAATQVNITDPRATTRSALVEPGQRLAVQEVPPTSYFHSGLATGPNAGCGELAAVPNGKALVVRQVRVMPTAQGNPTGYTIIEFYLGPACNIGPIGGVVPNAVGGQPLVVTWDPGIAVPAGGAVSYVNSTSYSVEVYLDGYTVPSSAVPPVGGQTIEFHGKQPMQR